VSEEALIERLERRIGLDERLTRLEDTFGSHRPWWRDTKTVTLVGSIFAVIIPVTTAIQGYVKGQSDLRLASQQQAHATRMDYLRATLEATAEKDRQSRLRMLVALVGPDDALHEWASGELARVEKEVAELESQMKNDVEQYRAKHAQAEQSAKQIAVLEQRENAPDVRARLEVERRQFEEATEQAKAAKQSATSRALRLEGPKYQERGTLGALILE
jgi:hypothetical protein